MFSLVSGLKTDINEVEGKRCMRGSDGRLCFSEKERGKVWKDYMEGIINEENDWDHNVKVDAVESPVVCVCREEVLPALNVIKTGKAPVSSDVSLELIAASGGEGIRVMYVICQRVLDAFAMPTEWALLSIVVPIFKGMHDIKNCG